jgi:hypothetical protein
MATKTGPVREAQSGLNLGEDRFPLLQKFKENIQNVQLLSPSSSVPVLTPTSQYWSPYSPVFGRIGSRRAPASALTTATLYPSFPPFPTPASRSVRVRFSTHNFQPWNGDHGAGPSASASLGSSPSCFQLASSSRSKQTMLLTTGP